MDRYIWNSMWYVGLFVGFFYWMLSGMASGNFGRLNIALLLLFPLFGIFRVRKSQNRVGKTLLITLHVIAICTIGFLLLLGFGMGEK
ncbi:hypothetical protein DRW41_16310 [Neobacillus piezotolerans]|uniref:Uncharacterized protein n=1 Tax=Neobacillus piezotolerans TaxID=2259171 RepID=A0A3D8GNQ4_9BACI|nr:hypothetical protein [Neobacillus piezotolerans]RDU35706.1 hypothetical protein DRW41_16310 [Neobacillus piezotolerans]